jgi:hypothetical protein
MLLALPDKEAGVPIVAVLPEVYPAHTFVAA